MQFNAEKCKVMHINHTLDTEYFMEKSGAVCKLGEVHEERDLGIMVSRELKTSLQCAKAAAKASSVLGMIRRHFEDLDGDSFLILYKGFVRPHLEYCVQAWSPHLRKDIDLMEKVQRRATKMVRGLKHHSYQRRLKVLGLQTLEQRRIRGDMIEVFKILTGREAVDPATYFVVAERKAVTRGHK